MKNIVVLFIAISVLCVSISGNVFSQELTSNVMKKTVVERNSLDDKYVSTAEATLQVANAAGKYLGLNENCFKSRLKTTEDSVDIPWISASKTGLFEWWINVRYNGVEDSVKIEMDPDEFQEFLKKPLYMREYFFNVDDDPEDDVQVKLGFYKYSILNMNSGTDNSAITTKVIIRTWFPDGTGVEDSKGSLQVWSEVRINYGTFKDVSRGVSKSFGLPRISIFNRLWDVIKNHKLGFFFEKLLDRRMRMNPLGDEPVAATQSDDDWVSVGMGYISLEGNRIPQVVEERFSFAKDSIFDPSILEQEMFPGGEDPYELKFGFRSYHAGTSDPSNAVYDIGFSAEFQPAVHMRTQYIPRYGYVYYHFDKDSRNYGGTKVTFKVDVIKGSGEDLPLLSLVFDKIDDKLGSSGSWISFDLNVNGFEYKASDRFDVGIIVDVPTLFTEKVEIKGLPKDVKFEWGIDKLDLDILPGVKFKAGLGVHADLTMSSDIDKIIVFYPKSDPSAPDAPFLEVTSIPASQHVYAGGSIDIVNGSLLKVDVQGEAGVTMSSGIGGVTVYYPKSDPFDPDMVFISIPHGLPSSASASVHGKLWVDLDNLMNPSNYVYGEMSHSCSSNVDEVDLYLPGASLPLLSFTDIPARAETRGELYWAQLKGYAYSSRSSAGGYDPIELNLEYGDYRLYNRLEIRDGYIYTRFKFANDGYFEFDTTKKMVGNVFRFYDNTPGDEKTLLLSVQDVSADDLHASWDIDTSGGKLKFKSLDFGGIVDTLNDLDLDISLESKSVSLYLDWVIGEKGNFEIEVNQDEDLPLHFDLSKPGLYESYIDITLSSTLHFDADWEWIQGYIDDNNNVHPGHITINKDSSEPNIKYFNFYFVYQDTYGIDAKLWNLEFYLDLEWCKPPLPRLKPYIWLEYYLSADNLDVDLLWKDANGDVKWYHNIEDWLDPHP